ncbi:hypothetical protein J0A68_14310 [Algoriphagus sp. H41]|uniref:Outer membrane protein beta-barrel domain-containing protein n=1 Tax=Algoriphagus oliviformis TaxID=2811231 RepID=A0ABS3C4S4_9BACT|nr:hypothetical protein [Algoriphagus oliviformis]MBN7812122.1 hypothetical protein [Algoriphagus oliviformis]
MKANQLLLATFLLVATPFISKAQDKPKLSYTIGAGTTIDRSNSLWGMNFTNEFNIEFRERTSFNLGLSFYQSLGTLYEKSLPEGSGDQNKEQSSGIFFTPSIKYDLIQSPSGFNLSLAAGPSLQLGGETYLRSYFTGDPFASYSTNKLQRLGVMAELEAEWNSKNPNLKNAVSLSAYGAEKTFAQYVNLTYKLRFGLGKN